MTATLALGFILGLRHALDADHLAAVAALGASKDGLRRALANGLSWGIGHALAIGAAGGVALALRSAVPNRLAMLFELAAAVMLVGLGVLALRGALRDRLHVHEHRHDGVTHAHLHFHAARHVTDAGHPQGAGAAVPAPHRHPHPARIALRPFLVGCVHGLAGSAALALLVLATVPTVLGGCLYLLFFGTGTTMGMAVMSILLGVPLVLARRSAVGVTLALRAAAGLGSVAAGLALAYTTGAAGGLFG
ncbi:MAG TPA: urease accessory protein [Candidatus Polarisedimenticolia bacterium]|jgi:ABC-type nickel/cobalt efflux system permease component RcnA|nr:urease accessory protein [Candidatus Polarisedimenticolia bacterium]